MEFQPLSNSNITIRPFVSTDAEAFVAAARESVATVGPWMPWCTPAFCADNALTWFSTCDTERSAGRAYDMGVFCASSGQLLGGAGINQLTAYHRYGNLGYWVRQSHQRKGIAKQAVSLLSSFGFQKLGLFRLEIVVATGNAPSQAVAAASGAFLESVARNRLFLQNQPVDANINVLLPGRSAS